MFIFLQYLPINTVYEYGEYIDTTLISLQKGGGMSQQKTDPYGWVLCPVCHRKTRVKVRDDTELKNFPLFCPKCKSEFIISVEHNLITYDTEPDEET